MIAGFVSGSNWNGKDVTVKLERALTGSLFEIGLAAESMAKLLVPLDTGRLKGSITTQSTKDGTNTVTPAIPSDRIEKPTAENMVYVGVGSNVEYALIQEFGGIVDGRKIRAQPYLRPSLDYVNGKALEITFNEGKAELREYL